MQSATINETTVIRLYDHPEGGDPIAVMTLGEFWADNADKLDQSERTMMRLLLLLYGVYHGGVCAADDWRVEVA